jgi:hypothetical protein
MKNYKDSIILMKIPNDDNNLGVHTLQYTQPPSKTFY